ncbi:MAG: Fic family protein [Candidatus Levybacteria bacterium]|nr:Fic family protein [Candidatus Levybacteria bacterium]
MFNPRLTLISPEILTKIARIDELKGRWIASANLNPYLLGRLKRSVLITSTGASTRIEGAKLSDESVEKLIHGIAMQKFADRDKQEVRGYYELLQNIFEAWENIRFSESSIKHFHRELLKYVEKDKLHRGEYKKGENRVEMVDAQGKRIGVLFDTTPAYLTPKQMQELVEWTQEALRGKKYHPLLIVGNFLVEFLNIHPFEDGNGRLSRILTNLLLLKEGYLYMSYVSHEKLIENKKPDYYVALRKSQKTFKTKDDNIIDWLNFFLDIILAQSEDAILLLSSENLETILSNKQLAVWNYLQGVPQASPKDLADKTGIARPTVNKITLRLLQLKKIERLGLGRSVRYRKLK